MEEQQIIDDIINELFGYDVKLKDEDPNKVKLKKAQKKEKEDELISQVNMICTTLEKELKDSLGESFSKNVKLLRGIVLRALQKEVSNGNKVIDSNGKINIGKISDIIIEQKSEIVEEYREETKNNNTTDLSENNNTNSRNVDKMELQNFDEQLEQYGLDLSEEDRENLKSALMNIQRIMQEIKDRYEVGEPIDKIIKEKMDSLSLEEKIKLEEELIASSLWDVLQEVNTPKEQNDIDEKDDNKKPDDIIPLSAEIAEPSSSAVKNVSECGEYTKSDLKLKLQVLRQVQESRKDALTQRDNEVPNIYNGSNMSGVIEKMDKKLKVILSDPKITEGNKGIFTEIPQLADFFEQSFLFKKKLTDSEIESSDVLQVESMEVAEKALGLGENDWLNHHQNESAAFYGQENVDYSVIRHKEIDEASEEEKKSVEDIYRMVKEKGSSSGIMGALNLFSEIGRNNVLPTTITKTTDEPESGDTTTSTPPGEEKE